MPFRIPIERELSFSFKRLVMEILDRSSRLRQKWTLSPRIAKSKAQLYRLRGLWYRHPSSK
jgi:hypothetical protein